jgi:hypothetical protein
MHQNLAIVHTEKLKGGVEAMTSATCRIWNALVLAASLAASTGASAQEGAAERAVASASVVLKLALGVEASRLIVLTADRATWGRGEGQPAMVVERTGACAFEMRPSGSPGLRIDFNRLSVPVQHACGTHACSVRFSGVERAICLTSATARDQCRGFLQIGPLPAEAARELLANIAMVHQQEGCRPINRR